MSITNILTSAPDGSNTSSSANFRAWAGQLSGQLVAAGWVITADTGQTVPGSLVGSPGLNTSAGFQIFKPADTLQSTAPMFLKLGYGEGQNGGVTGASPAVFISLGTSTDGAGTLTGQFTSVYQLSSAGSSASSFNSYFCGDINRFAVALWSDPGFAGKDEIFFSIERTKDASGADTNVGAVLVAHCTGNTSWTNHGPDSQSSPMEAVLPFAGSVPAIQTPLRVPFSQLGTLQNGADFGVLFVVPMGYQPYNPGLGTLVYQGTDFTPYTSQVIPGVYSASHTYLPLSQATQLCAHTYDGSGVSSNCHLLMRWE